MIRILGFVLTTFFIPSSAFSGSCPAKIDIIDAALAKGTVKNADKVKTLRDKGEAQHKAGKHTESVTTLTDALKLAGIR